MKRIMRRLPLLSLLFSAVLMAGCQKDAPASGDGLSARGDGQVMVTLKVSTPGVPAAPANGRSLSLPDENAIKTIDLLVFDRSSKLVAHKTPSSISASGNVTTFNVELMASQSGSDTYRIAVFANARDFLQNLLAGNDLGGLEGSSYGTVYEALNDGWNASSSHYAVSGIAMWGEYRDFMVIKSTTSYPLLRMIRALARVDVGTNPTTTFDADGNVVWEKLDNFSLEEVMVYKPADKYSVLPKRDNFDFSANKVTKPSVPSSASKIAHMSYGGSLVSRDVAVGTHMQSEIYMPESDVVMGGERFDANHTNRAALVVGGLYNGSSTKSYYRVDFRNNSDGKLCDILRNHNYVVVINKVSGSGYTDPDDAYKALDSYIEATVVEWNTAPVNVVFDGTKRLTLSHDKVLCGKEGITSKIVVTVTTTDPAGLSAAPLAQGIDVTYGLPATWTNVSVAPPNGYTGNDKLEITINGIDANGTGQDRGAKFMITSGNMNYEFRIEQRAISWLTAAVDPFYSLDGFVKSLKVSSLGNWTAAVKAGSDPAGAIINLMTKAGGMKDNEKCLFVPYDGVKNTPVMAPQNVVMRFEDPSGINPPQDVTIRLKVPLSYLFAKGNIVIDRKHPDRLAFAENANAQGLAFKWGSLIGILGEGADKGLEGNVYDMARDAVFKPAELDPGVDLSTWDGIPYARPHDGPTDYQTDIIAMLYPAEGAYAEGVREDEGRGDICRYMTQKGWVPSGTRWRMPTTNECSELYSEVQIATKWENRYGYMSGTDGEWQVNLNGSGYPGTRGDFPINNGWFIGIKIDSPEWTPESMGVTPANVVPGLVFMPESGWRDIDGSMTRSVNTNGRYWSTGVWVGSTHSFIMENYYNYLGPANYLPRSCGIPIRCIRY